MPRIYAESRLNYLCTARELLMSCSRESSNPEGVLLMTLMQSDITSVRR